MKDDLVERLNAVVPYQGKSSVAFIWHEAADRIEKLTEALRMSTAEMQRAREPLAIAKEHRIAASLGKQCDFNRAALSSEGLSSEEGLG